MVAHPGRRITPFDQAALFGFAYVKTMTMDKAVTGFESPGLWPFNPDKIPVPFLLMVINKYNTVSTHY